MTNKEENKKPLDKLEEVQNAFKVIVKYWTDLQNMDPKTDDFWIALSALKQSAAQFSQMFFQLPKKDVLKHINLIDQVNVIHLKIS